MGSWIVKLSVKNNFRIEDHCDLDPEPLNPQGSSSDQDQYTCKVRGSWAQAFSSYWLDTIFTLKVIVTLTFDFLTPKSIGLIYWLRQIYMWSLKAKGQSVLKLLSGNNFKIERLCDLDLWPINPKVNRAHLLTKTNTHVKFEDCGAKRSQVIEQKRLSYWRSLWPWPLTYWPQNQ